MRKKNKNRCLPVGDLPYGTDKATTKMMVKLFENIPFLANLPSASKEESILNRTIVNLPGISKKGNKILFNADDSALKTKILELDAAFNKPSEQNIEQYGLETFFLPKYYQILDRIKPTETVINLIGPFSLLLMLKNDTDIPLIADKFYRKVIVQAISVRVMWLLNKIVHISPETKPIIILEEPLLYKAGDVKRENEDVTQDVIINMFKKVISTIQACDAEVGVQCFEKCDWQIPIEAGANIISFGAYNNPNNLNIIPEKVNEFLARGGKINWAIVPVNNETMIKSYSLEQIYDRFVTTIEGLIASGVSEKLAYNRALVSVQGNLDHLSIFFAEKALIIANQIAKKIPVKS